MGFPQVQEETNVNLCIKLSRSGCWGQAKGVGWGWAGWWGGLRSGPCVGAAKENAYSHVDPSHGKSLQHNTMHFGGSGGVGPVTAARGWAGGGLACLLPALLPALPAAHLWPLCTRVFLCKMGTAATQNFLHPLESLSISSLSIACSLHLKTGIIKHSQSPKSS